jgi:hypothetical protein
MKFWKLPELDRELESYLDLMLTPVGLCQGFSRDLKRRLLNDFPRTHNNTNIFQSMALVFASIYSVMILVLTGMRAVIFLLSMFGMLRQTRGEMQQKHTAA